MHPIRISLLALAALAAVGCGSNKCPMETPGVSRVPSCTVSPGTAVTVQVQTCITCNQTAPTCNVDLSQLSSGQIFLDPKAEVCESVTSCGDRGSSCASNPLIDCTFTAPSATGSYNLVAFDPSTNSPRTGRLDVQAGAAYSCAFSLR
jgi:hypothetical protein